MGLYFFLSYAHGDQADDERVERFSADLSTEIRARTGDDQDIIVGFHDFRNLRIGDTWPHELIEAMSTARTFVALCSPRYFRSLQCGREWTVFARRVHAYLAETGRRAPSIIPVFWIPTEVPPALGDIHQRDRSFGELYEAEGLRELMRLERRREYDSFVGALARRVQEVFRAYPLPVSDQRPDFHTVPSAFGPGDSGDPWADPPRQAPVRRQDGRPPPQRPILKLDTCDSPE